MCHHCHNRKITRRGMTLLELLIAITILVMIAGTLATLAKGVQQGFEYSEGHGAATQHARVVLDRICRTAQEATANEQFPGVLVLAAEIASWRFPDTLVVWHPSGQPADADGLPRFHELVIYCPDPRAPAQLVEITVPNDTRTVPPPSDTARWESEIAAIKMSNGSQKVTLTGLLRTSLVDGNSELSRRGAVRFETRLRPSDTDWAAYTTDRTEPKWKALPWVQGIYGRETGLRQTWVRIELQLVPADTATGGDADSVQAVPFFGSAAVYYEMHR